MPSTVHQLLLSLLYLKSLHVDIQDYGISVQLHYKTIIIMDDGRAQTGQFLHFFPLIYVPHTPHHTHMLNISYQS